jgi:hypothetical protein
MEEQSLTDYLAEHRKPTGENSQDLQLWYNPYGDCVEYQTEQVAIVADRIGEYLTIYRSAETDKAIGFQLKDVKALMKKYTSPVQLEWKTKGNTLVSVSALLLAAMEAEVPFTIKKRSGFLDAMRNLSKTDEVMLS